MSTRPVAIAAALAALSLGLGAAGSAHGQLPLPTSTPGPAPLARIVYRADLSLYSVSADGSGRQRLTQATDGARDAEPVFSPDGGTIAFTRYRRGRDRETARIWLMNADGAQQRPLTPELGRLAFDSSPTWSPDGSRLAFVRVRASDERGTVAIVSVAADGSDARTIHREVNDFEDDDELVLFSSPAWSPDGTRILYTDARLGGRDDFRPSLHVVDAQGGAPRRLARTADHGAWSPDASRIAFVGPGGECQADNCDFYDGAGAIYTMNADGSGVTRLTNDGGDASGLSWSADGRIAFASTRNYPVSYPELYTMRPDGSCLTWLTNGTADSREPAWEPAAGLSSDPGACGAIPREPLVETKSSRAERFDRFPVYWLGRVSEDGLLLTHAGVSREGVYFGYDDCGRFDPSECPEAANVVNSSACTSMRYLRGAGRRPRRLSILRGALLQRRGDDEISLWNVHTGRTRLEVDTPSGKVTSRSVLEALRRVGQDAPAAKLPAARLPADLWSRLTRTRSGHLVALRKRLSELGVTGRIRC